MFIFLKLIDGLNVVSTKIPGDSLREIDRLILKFVWKSKSQSKDDMMKKPGMVVHAYCPSTQEADARESGIQGQPGIHSEILSQKRKKKKKKRTCPGTNGSCL
jgi:hypothetical protein